MASDPHDLDEWPRPRLYLVTPAIERADDILPALKAALGAADIAAVLLRLAPADERTLINRVKAIAPLVQAAEAALVVEGHPNIVARGGADGAHLIGIAEFEAAKDILKPQRIAGASGLLTRHDGMLAAEAGADYVMFGDVAHDGERQDFNTVLERIGWWVEVFETPCVGFAQSMKEVEAIAQEGAEFVAVGDLVFAHKDGIAAGLAEVSQRLVTREPAS